MTKEERMLEKQKARAQKLKPKPVYRGGAWRCQVMVNGESISVTRETPEAAHAEALAIKAGLIQRNSDIAAARISLSDALDLYIDDRRDALSPSTVAGYREERRNRLQDLWGKRVCDIQERDLQIAISAEAKAGHAAKTIKNDISLAVAVISQYKTINTKRLKYPQRAKTEHKYLEPDEIVRLIDGCRGDRSEIPILLALWMGLRRSEILGLCWDCIDPKRGTVTVRRAFVRGQDGGHILKDLTKNESSQRVVSCPSYIMDRLTARPLPHEGRVFPGNDTAFIYHDLKRLCESEGITFPGVHGLRHTNASVMLSLGIIDRYAMARGGWATDHTMKEVYQHLFSDHQKDADSVVNEYFESLTRGKG